MVMATSTSLPAIGDMGFASIKMRGAVLLLNFSWDLPPTKPGA